MTRPLKPLRFTTSNGGEVIFAADQVRCAEIRQQNTRNGNGRLSQRWIVMVNNIHVYAGCKSKAAAAYRKAVRYIE